MKQSEIKVAHTYFNSSEHEYRQILHIYKDHYNGKKYVDYKITYLNGEVGLIENLMVHILLKSFARWAKKDVS